MTLTLKKKQKVKTYDIAIKHLKGIDLSPYNTEYYLMQDKITKSEQDFMNLIDTVYMKYVSDSSHTESDGNYIGTVFAVALLNEVDRTHGLEPPFDMACKIVEQHKSITLTEFEPYDKTHYNIYPKIMADKWIKYCDGLKNTPIYLKSDSSIRMQFLFCAYHHLITKNTFIYN